MSGEGAGYSAQGGAAGPSQAGLTSTSTFAIGGNAGIGSSTGLNMSTIAIMGLIAVGVIFMLTRGKR